MSEVCNTLTMSMEKDSGFTLVELLITIIVVSVLLAVGVPSFKEFIKNNRLTAQSSELVIALQLARNEAVKRHSAATICASTTQTSCNVTDSDWTHGWIIFSDLNQDATPDLGTNACLETEDCIMRTSKGLSGNNTLTANTNQLLFYPTGLVRSSDVPAAFTLTADKCHNNQVRNITVNVQGHTTISKAPCP